MTDDVVRMGQAVSHPGIDPRVWLTLAVVTDVKTEAGGVYFDITTITGIDETAVYMPVYGGKDSDGNSYGQNCPIEAGMMVVVAIPEGDFGVGARVLGVVKDTGTPIPAEVQANPDDYVIVVKKGQTARIVVDGEGDIDLEVRGSGKLKLGGADASDPVPLKSTLQDINIALPIAIASCTGDSPAQHALTALKTALDNLQFPRCSTTIVGK